MYPCIASIIVNGHHKDSTVWAYLFIHNQLDMFRGMFSPVIRSNWLYLQLLMLSTVMTDYITSEAVNTVKCSWWWAKISPEICRADWVQINKPKGCILLVISYEQEICLFSKRTDWLWGPLSLLFSEYRGSFSQEKRPRRDLNHHYLVRGIRRSGAVPISPPRAFVVRIGSTFPFT